MKDTRDTLESRLAGIVERAATNGKGLAVAMPAGIVGGRFGAAPAAPETAQDSPVEAPTGDAAALNALVHKIAGALTGADMDHAITALISLAVTYAKSPEAPPELRVATAERLLMAVEAVGEAYERMISDGIQAVSVAGWVPMKLQPDGGVNDGP